MAGLRSAGVRLWLLAQVGTQAACCLLLQPFGSLAQFMLRKIAEPLACFLQPHFSGWTWECDAVIRFAHASNRAPGFTALMARHERNWRGVIPQSFGVLGSSHNDTRDLVVISASCGLSVLNSAFFRLRFERKISHEMPTFPSLDSVKRAVPTFGDLAKVAAN